ncbi:MAG: hypothetical protein PVF58_10060 [Candidatus Methanofastidiosia archaeon]|jgi:hypothetical protein
MVERMALEAVRHQYVVSFAGFYGEFKNKTLVGIEEKVLKKTDLIPYLDRVTISKFESQSRTPAYLREHFTVVPVNEREFSINTSLLKQKLGLAFLSENVSLSESLEIGDKIVLNAVLAKKFLMREKGGNPEKWAEYLTKNFLSKKRSEL